jgi:hypothetical protein
VLSCGKIYKKWKKYNLKQMATYLGLDLNTWWFLVLGGVLTGYAEGGIKPKSQCKTCCIGFFLLKVLAQRRLARLSSVLY